LNGQFGYFYAFQAKNQAMRILLILLLFLFHHSFSGLHAQSRARDLGIKIGVLPTGPLNAITDVNGVLIGQVTRIRGRSIRTGVTAIIPYAGNIFQHKVPAAIYLANGFGKLAGYSQVEELGNLETPIVLTNTLSVPIAVDALIDYTLDQKGNEQVYSVNAVVGETNDSYLNEIREQHIRKKDVWKAIANASGGPVAEGNVGAGTGTRCFGFKGGIGTASRHLPAGQGGYTVGVLVQSNFGGVLTINGAPIGQQLGQYYLKDQIEGSADGSCMMVVATDAPLDARNLKRLAKRAQMGLARTGGIASNGSGDYVIAFSTAEGLRVPYNALSSTQTQEILHNDFMSPLFLATIEATEEAIINSLFMARTLTGNGRTVKALPVERVLELMGKK